MPATAVGVSRIADPLCTQNPRIQKIRRCEQASASRTQQQVLSSTSPSETASHLSFRHASASRFEGLGFRGLGAKADMIVWEEYSFGRFGVFEMGPGGLVNSRIRHKLQRRTLSIKSFCAREERLPSIHHLINSLLLRI